MHAVSKYVTPSKISSTSIGPEAWAVARARRCRRRSREETYYRGCGEILDSGQNSTPNERHENAWRAEKGGWPNWGNLYLIERMAP